jgi:hypothetical protein
MHPSLRGVDKHRPEENENLLSRNAYLGDGKNLRKQGGSALAFQRQQFERIREENH